MAIIGRFPQGGGAVKAVHLNKSAATGSLMLSSSGLSKISGFSLMLESASFNVNLSEAYILCASAIRTGTVISTYCAATKGGGTLMVQTLAGAFSVTGLGTASLQISFSGCGMIPGGNYGVILWGE